MGLNATRAYTILNGTTCSVGRVQTPTLALVVSRQREIQAFKPVPYAEIHVDLGFRARLLLGGKTRIDDLARARAIFAEIKPWPTATVTSVETREVRTPPPPLFNLLALQKEANRRWGLTAARVLQLAQELYERKHLTYPRTESRHLSTDMVKDLPRLVAALAPEYPQLARPAAEALAGDFRLGKAYVDDTKLTDHHAILPTTEVPGPELAGDHRRLYDLVARRFLAIFLPPRVADETTVELALKAYTLRATGFVVKDPGWTLVPDPDDTPRDAEAEPGDDDEPDERQALPPLVIGQRVPKRGERLIEKETRPPKPYTDASLLDAMKRAGRLVTDKDLAEHMKENGLGTAATRAETIEKLVRASYLERKKKHLLPTPKGFALVDQVDAQLRDPVLTAQWEERLADIEDGNANARDLEADVASWVARLVPTILRSKPMTEETAQEGIGPCPKCKTGVVRKTPKGWGCSRYKEAGCDFVIWAQVAGKAIGESVARELVTGGMSARVIEGFVSKEKKTFGARLKLDPEPEGRLRLRGAPARPGPRALPGLQGGPRPRDPEGLGLQPLQGGLHALHLARLPRQDALRARRQGARRARRHVEARRRARRPGRQEEVLREAPLRRPLARRARLRRQARPGQRAADGLTRSSDTVPDRPVLHKPICDRGDASRHPGGSLAVETTRLPTVARATTERRTSS